MIPLCKTPTLVDYSVIFNTLSSGMLGEGPRVIEFTERLQKVLEHNRPLCVNSCTSALVLALRLLDSNPGQEVLVSPFTMMATISAIETAGLTPSWVDVDPETFCMDLSKTYMSSRVCDPAAVLITCVGGLVPKGLDKFLQECPVPVIFDCAHALSTHYHGQHISKLGRASCFSFQSIKHLTTGDGGAICVQRDRDYERVEKLKWFGMTREVPPGRTRLEHQMTADIDEWGYKFHMNDVAAAIGLTSLNTLPTVLHASANNAACFQSRLANIPQLRLPVIPLGCEPAWWMYGFLAPERDRLMSHLAVRGIASSPLWRRCDTYSASATPYEREPLPGMDRVAAEAIFIPSGYWVNNEQREHIISSIREFYYA